MDLLTRDLLINFLVILIPLLLLQLVYLLKYTYRFKESEEWLFALFPITSTALCMLFPVDIDEYIIWDLRAVPFLIAILYSGPKLGIFLLSMILSARYLVGGIGFWVTLFAFSFLFILSSALFPYYLKMSLKRKLLTGSLLICLFIISVFFVAEYRFSVDIYTSKWLEFFAVNLIGFFITTILWEAIKTNFDVLQQLIKAEKLEIVSHLAASISHEVRNPLTVSRGFMQLTEEEISYETRKHYVNTAIQELDRAADIINDYLTFAKPTLENKEKIKIVDEMNHVTKIITPLANMNGVIIKNDLRNEEYDFVLGERKKFQQCLINILKNAVESMPDGGELKIKVTCLSLSIMITIEDEGKGMTQEQIQHIGEPYFTTKETGTGLGMMVSFSVIKGMGGKIGVESEPGKGTCFSIQLPLAQSL